MGWRGMFVVFLVIIMLVVGILVIIMLVVGKRKACPHCKSDNAKDAVVCQKCGRDM